MRNFMLIVHLIGLAMGVGTNLAHLFLAMAGMKMEKKDAIKFALNNFSLNKMGVIGLCLLIGSGSYLIRPYEEDLANNPFLIAKLAMVLVLAVLLGTIVIISRKAKKGDPEKQLNKLKILGPIILLVSLSIIVLTVYAFN
jgi:putative copper export protein